MNIDVYQLDWDAVAQDDVLDIIHKADPPSIIRAWTAGKYEHVATLDLPQSTRVVDTLDIAYEKTNNINHAWTENSEVTAHVSPCRSTSVGDVIVVEGIYHIVSRVGFVSTHMPP
jgi:hypothetical protein